MLKFAIKRLLHGSIILLGVASMVFFLFAVLPGDAAQMTLGQRSDVSTLEAVKAEFGLDKPIHMQYFMFMNDISPISIYKNNDNEATRSDALKLFKINSYYLYVKFPYLRKSYQSKKTVNQILAEAFPATLLLATTAMLFATVLGISLGTIAAYQAEKWPDKILTLLAMLGVSIPSFLAAILIAYVFGFLLSSYTGLNLTGSMYSYDVVKGPQLALKNLILPALTLGIRPLSIIVQLSRNSIIDQKKQDYVRTAKAKGLNTLTIFSKHIFRNAMGPVVTSVSGWFASLLAGAVFVEYVFGWNGLGKLTIDALLKFDLPVVMGAVLLVGSLFILINILVDLLYAILDPRIAIES